MRALRLPPESSSLAKGRKLASASVRYASKSALSRSTTYLVPSFSAIRYRVQELCGEKGLFGLLIDSRSFADAAPRANASGLARKLDSFTVRRYLPAFGL